MTGRRWAGRRLRAALAAALVLDLAVLAADLYLLDGVSETTEVDLADALVDFRSDPVAEEVASAPAGGAEVTGPAGPPAGPPDLPVSPAAATSSSPAPVTTTTMAAASGSFRPPAAGVYEYRTSGGETVSLLGARHDYPATTFAVVHHTGGCGWRIRAEVVREHIDERRMCSDPDRVLQHEQSRQVEFFGTKDGAAYVCDPPQVQHAGGDGEGATTTVDCGDGRGSSARLVRTTLGLGQAMVGGLAVEVVRLRIDGTLTGRYRGTSVDLLTLDAATGLPVTWERSVDTVAEAFGASIRYREQARFDLVSLTPTT